MEKKWKKEMASRKKSCEKNPVGTLPGTLPLELEEGGPIDAFNPLQKQGNSVCSRDRYDIQHFY